MTAGLSRLRRGILLLAVAALGTGTLAAPAQAAAPTAWKSGPCAPGRGVTVIADLTHFSGGKVVRRCDLSVPATSYQALVDVGLGPVRGTGEGQHGPYQYLCRISARPTPAQDPCTGFRPAAPYWAFWVPNADRGDWAYADEGVDTHQPTAGAVLGFSFGAGSDTDPNRMSLTPQQATDPNWRARAVPAGR